MKKFVLAAVLALPCLALTHATASAHGGIDTGCLNLGGCFNLKIGFAAKGWVNYQPPSGCAPCGGGGGYGGFCGAGGPGCPYMGPGAPWYAYWPYEAHFQTPAPVGFPYWPGPQVPYGAAGGGLAHSPSPYYWAR